jgi:hypothetical protein
MGLTGRVLGDYTARDAADAGRVLGMADAGRVPGGTAPAMARS